MLEATLPGEVRDGAQDGAAIRRHLAVLLAYVRADRVDGKERDLVDEAASRLALRLLELHAPEPPDISRAVDESTRQAQYRELVERVVNAVMSSVPQGARVAVISKGDEALLRVPGLSAVHFPADESGGYAGFYPADGEDALAHLASVARDGAGYLVIPDTARWWLEYYAELADYLRARCITVIDEPGACAVFELPAVSQEPAEALPRPQSESSQERGLRMFAHALLPPASRAGFVTTADGRVQVLARALGEDEPAVALSLPGNSRDGVRAAGVQYLVLSSDPLLEGLQEDMSSELEHLATREGIGSVFEIRPIRKDERK